MAPSCGHILSLSPADILLMKAQYVQIVLFLLQEHWILFKSRKALTHTHTNALSKVKIHQRESFPGRLEWIRPNLHTLRGKEKNSIQANIPPIMSHISCKIICKKINKKSVMNVWRPSVGHHTGFRGFVKFKFCVLATKASVQDNMSSYLQAAHLPG